MESSVPAQQVIHSSVCNPAIKETLLKKPMFSFHHVELKIVRAY